MMQPSITLSAALSHAFRLGVFRFTLKPKETLFVPAVNKTNMLRGAFGTAFRRLCCIPQCRSAQECPLATACPYKQIFEPSPPADSERLSKSQDVPRPFIFRALENTKTKFLPGEEFQFELVLIGRALESLPYFVLSFRELAAHGLGLNRAKCDLIDVKEFVNSDVSGTSLGGLTHTGSDLSSALEQMPRFLTIYSSADQVFHTPKGLDLEKWISNRMSSLFTALSPMDPMTGFPDNSMTVRISFLTPVLLKSEGSVVRRPEFHHVFKRLRDRVNALGAFFGTGPLDVDFAAIGRRAEQVRTVSCNVEWQERFRTSSKTHQRHELSGFVGTAEYSGDLREFLPWLVLGVVINIGKHTAWNGGRIEVVSA
jgi:CRISPR/Cas system endoribonuclease Cas6 (RAMP superfamily)